MDGYLAINWTDRKIVGPVHFSFQAAALDLGQDNFAEVVNVEVEEDQDSD